MRAAVFWILLLPSLVSATCEYDSDCAAEEFCHFAQYEHQEAPAAFGECLPNRYSADFDSGLYDSASRVWLEPANSGPSIRRRQGLGHESVNPYSPRDATRGNDQ